MDNEIEIEYQGYQDISRIILKDVTLKTWKFSFAITDIQYILF